MSKLGYYRYKLEGLSKGIRQVTFYVNGLAYLTHTVKVRETCTGWRQLKWLDENGQYRFFAFTEFYKVTDSPKQIGQSSNFITSLFDSQTNAKNIGQSNERSILLRAVNVTSEERSILASLAVSPRVYLYTGDFTKDESSDYIQVTVKTDGVAKNEKGRPGNFEVTVALPKYYTQTMI